VRVGPGGRGVRTRPGSKSGGKHGGHAGGGDCGSGGGMGIGGGGDGDGGGGDGFGGGGDGFGGGGGGGGDGGGGGGSGADSHLRTFGRSHAVRSHPLSTTPVTGSVQCSADLPWRRPGRSGIPVSGSKTRPPCASPHTSYHRCSRVWPSQRGLSSGHERHMPSPSSSAGCVFSTFFSALRPVYV